MAKLVGVVIDRSSPIPLYHQLAEQLAAAITSGSLQPGDPFENEVALAERLGLSRPTVRQAIQELVAQGLLLRRRGLGPTVANRSIPRRAELTSLWDDLDRAGGRPRTVLLSHTRGADETVATALDLPADCELLAIQRLRLAGEAPLAILRNWLPPPLTDVSREELESDGLYALLRAAEGGERGAQAPSAVGGARGGTPSAAHQPIGARIPTPAERRHLRM